MSSNGNNVNDEVAHNSAQYVLDYLDFVHNMPDDIQRHITELREIDVKYQEILRELDCLWETLATKDDDAVVRKRVLLQAQNSMIRAQEYGDLKLQIWQTIQDLIENKSRQLDIDLKKLDFGRESDIHHDNHKSETHSDKSHKRVRRHHHHHHHQRQADIFPDDKVHDRSDIVSAPIIYKKQKKRRKSKVEKEPLPPQFEPIDPNEPTYCLCDQVSFGEMICCDNQNCPQEWFHFSCVGLTFKPKGKWYCPTCRGERSNQMKPTLP